MTATATTFTYDDIRAAATTRIEAAQVVLRAAHDRMNIAYRDASARWPGEANNAGYIAALDAADLAYHLETVDARKAKRAAILDIEAANHYEANGTAEADAYIAQAAALAGRAA